MSVIICNSEVSSRLGYDAVAVDEYVVTFQRIVVSSPAGSSRVLCVADGKYSMHTCGSSEPLPSERFVSMFEEIILN
jgi:hypothetical protein